MSTNVVQQTTVIQVGSQKSVVGAVLLAFLFGPLGMLYSTVVGAIVMFFVSIPIVIVTLGLGLLLTIPICMLWAGMAASSHNKRLQTVATQQAIGGQATAPAWHEDPDGSGRLRYHDGTRWTDHYSDSPREPVEAEPATVPEALPAIGGGPAEVVAASDEEEITVVLKSSSAVSDETPCRSCGRDVSSTARFCPACGATQATD